MSINLDIVYDTATSLGRPKNCTAPVHVLSVRVNRNGNDLVLGFNCLESHLRLRKPYLLIGRFNRLLRALKTNYYA